MGRQVYEIPVRKAPVGERLPGVGVLAYCNDDRQFALWTDLEVPNRDYCDNCAERDGLCGFIKADKGELDMIWLCPACLRRFAGMVS